jgi:hypothetical protein
LDASPIPFAKLVAQVGDLLNLLQCPIREARLHHLLTQSLQLALWILGVQRDEISVQGYCRPASFKITGDDSPDVGQFICHDLV